MGTRKGRWPLAALAILALAGGAFSACGEDDPPPAGGGESEARSELLVEATGSGRTAELKAPATAPAGVVEVTLTNSADKGEHSLHLLRVDGEEPVADLMKAGDAWGEKGKPLPEAITFAGGVGVVERGQSKSSTLSLDPGRYVLLDFNNGGGRELVKEIELTGEPGGDLPAADATVTATEYEFAAEGLKPGRNLIRWVNDGAEPHHLIAAPIKPGKTIEDVREAFASDAGPPPINQRKMVEVPIIEGGREQLAELELDPGEYALLCFIPDRAGGPPHALKGMISAAEVG